MVYITTYYIITSYSAYNDYFIFNSFLYKCRVCLHDCQPAYNLHLYVWGGACYQYRTELDMIFNAMGSVFTKFTVNLVLIVKYIRQRHRIKLSIISTIKNKKWVRFVFLLLQNFFYLFSDAHFSRFRYYTLFHGCHIQQLDSHFSLIFQFYLYHLLVFLQCLILKENVKSTWTAFKLLTLTD